MKTAALLSAAAMTFVCAFATAQQKKATASPQPIPMAAPAMKVQTPEQSSQQQTSQPQSTQQNLQQQNTNTKSAANSKKAADKSAAPAPAVDNKIAVSDPGTPAEKSSTNKKSSSGNQPAEKKAAPANTGISPK